MDVFVFGALCDEGREHETAWHLLSRAVEQVFGLTEVPEVAKGERGKPFFPERPDIFFNLSHSRGAAVCAVHDKTIGVDVEKIRPAPKRLANGLEDRAFFRLWTAKEATLKRDGGTLAALLREYEPDALCETHEEFLCGWIVTICPSESSEIHYQVVESIG